MSDDYGHGDSQTFPQSPGGSDPNNPLPPTATEESATNVELDRAMREFERQHPGAQGGKP
jgi:hypothetical protein